MHQLNKKAHTIACLSFPAKHRPDKLVCDPRQWRGPGIHHQGVVTSAGGQVGGITLYPALMLSFVTRETILLWLLWWPHDSWGLLCHWYTEEITIAILSLYTGSPGPLSWLSNKGWDKCDKPVWSAQFTNWKTIQNRLWGVLLLRGHGCVMENSNEI